ncbi:Uncharacterised protein [Candidatus Anstonella stagnisolia]|nr:Uncharacterised protein [Candidatus Anstonella stagnisolia]
MARKAASGRKEFQEVRTTDRLAAFSDAIFAFAMTLLVFEIKVPDVPDNVSGGVLTTWMISFLPKFLVYILSFVVLGIFWVAHHRMFRRINLYNENLIWLNLLFLLTISLLPFPTAILGEYAHEPVAVSLYAACMALCGVFMSVIWMYADSKGFISKKVDRSHVDSATRTGLITSCVFIVSIPISLHSPQLAVLSWLLIFPLRFFVK